MSKSQRKEIAIVGIGETEVGRVPGKTPLRLHIEAIKLALEDAGLNKDEIDGIITPDNRLNPYDTRASVLAEYLGIEPNFPLCQAWGGQSTLSMIFYAASAIVYGVANTVVIACGDNTLSGPGVGGTTRSFIAAGGVAHMNFEWPYGPSIPGMLALMAQRHMYEFGTTSEQLANVAVTFRNNAMRHPKAQMRDPITIDDVLNSRMIASPLHLLDCCVVSDGGHAVIVTSAERAKHLKQKPIYLLGAAEAHQGMHPTFLKSLVTTAAVASGEKAFEMAGVQRKDMDVLGLCDPGTIAMPILLEDLGFCKKGEGGPFVEGGRLGIDGELPTNTHGGLLSYCHPGRAQTICHMMEVVLQLRGQADKRQVKGAKLGLVHAASGPFTSHITLILGN